MNPSKDSSSEAEDEKQEDGKIATQDSQRKESKEPKEDSSQQKKKPPFVGIRPGYGRKTRFDVRDVTTAPSKPADSKSLDQRREDKPAEKGKEEEAETATKDEDKHQDPDMSEKDTEDGKKDSKFKFKFSSGKKLKTPTTTSSQSTSTTLASSVTSNSSVPPKPTVSAPKSLPMIGKRSKSKLVISRPEAPPEPAPERETEEKYKEMKNSLDRFLQMKSGSLPVVVEKGKDKQDATKDGEKVSAPLPPSVPPPPPPPPTGPGLSGDNAAISNRDNIAKAYQDIAAKEKAAEKQAELLVPPQPPTSIIHNPPLPPSGVSDVIKETLTVYSTAHQYKMPTPPVAPPPIVNTSLPPPPPPNFMIAAGVIPAPPTLPAPQAPPLLPDPPQVPDQPPPPPPPGTQDELMNDFLAEYGELLPEADENGDDSDEGNLLFDVHLSRMISIQIVCNFSLVDDEWICFSCL